MPTRVVSSPVHAFITAVVFTVLYALGAGVAIEDDGVDGDETSMLVGPAGGVTTALVVVVDVAGESVDGTGVCGALGAGVGRLVAGGDGVVPAVGDGFGVTGGVGFGEGRGVGGGVGCGVGCGVG